MKKTFKGWLFNRLERMGERTYNHIGCEGDEEEFIDFLTRFIPTIGTRRRVKFTVETDKEIEKIKEYKIEKDYYPED